MRRTNGPDGSPQRRLEPFVTRARLAILWERAWPRIWVPLSVVALFLAASWFGLWLALPPVGRMAGVGLFALLFLISFWPLARVRRPARANALDRIDRDSGLRHGPARALDDSLALGTADAGTQALWELHRKRAEAALADLRVAPPRPD
ncbi:DUF4175 family protein, partial [Corallococcus exiguus]|nr:DUF4175 family protein [Corallococcus exiguus]